MKGLRIPKGDGNGSFGGLTVLTESVGDGVRVHVSGEVDVSNAQRVTDALQKAEASTARTIVLDLSQVSYLDSSGLRMLINASARSRQDGNRLQIVPSGTVQRIIERVGISDRLPLRPN